MHALPLLIFLVPLATFRSNYYIVTAAKALQAKPILQSLINNNLSLKGKHNNNQHIPISYQYYDDTWRATSNTEDVEYPDYEDIGYNEHGYPRNHAKNVSKIPMPIFTSNLYRKPETFPENVWFDIPKPLASNRFSNIMRYYYRGNNKPQKHQKNNYLKVPKNHKEISYQYYDYNWRRNYDKHYLNNEKKRKASYITSDDKNHLNRDDYNNVPDHKSYDVIDVEDENEYKAVPDDRTSFDYAYYINDNSLDKSRNARKDRNYKQLNMLENKIKPKVEFSLAPENNYIEREYNEDKQSKLTPAQVENVVSKTFDWAIKNHKKKLKDDLIHKKISKEQYSNRMAKIDLAPDLKKNLKEIISAFAQTYTYNDVILRGLKDMLYTKPKKYYKYVKEKEKLLIKATKSFVDSIVELSLKMSIESFRQRLLKLCAILKKLFNASVRTGQSPMEILNLLENQVKPTASKSLLAHNLAPLNKHRTEDSILPERLDQLMTDYMLKENFLLSLALIENELKKDYKAGTISKQDFDNYINNYVYHELERIRLVLNRLAQQYNPLESSKAPIKHDLDKLKTKGTNDVDFEKLIAIHQFVTDRGIPYNHVTQSLLEKMASDEYVRVLEEVKQRYKDGEYTKEEFNTLHEILKKNVADMKRLAKYYIESSIGPLLEARNTILNPVLPNIKQKDNRIEIPPHAKYVSEQGLMPKVYGDWLTEEELTWSLDRFKNLQTHLFHEGKISKNEFDDTMDTITSPSELLKLKDQIKVMLKPYIEAAPLTVPTMRFNVPSNSYKEEDEENDTEEVLNSYEEHLLKKIISHLKRNKPLTNKERLYVENLANNLLPTYDEYRPIQDQITFPQIGDINSFDRSWFMKRPPKSRFFFTRESWLNTL